MMTLAIKRGFQSDGKSQLERIALRVTGGNGEEKAYYRFQVNPQNLKESYAQRTTMFKTRSATVVEDYGRDLPTIEFSGTTGYKKDKNGNNGAVRLAILKDFLETYSNAGHRVDDNGTEALEMQFYNLTDGGSYVVHLAQEGFQIERSVDQPLLYNYRIALVVLRNANDPDVRDIDQATLGNTTSNAINPNSREIAYKDAVQEINKSLGMG